MANSTANLCRFIVNCRIDDMYYILVSKSRGIDDIKTLVINLTNHKIHNASMLCINFNCHVLVEPSSMLTSGCKRKWNKQCVVYTEFVLL